jgi:serine/threonine protein kinase
VWGLFFRFNDPDQHQPPTRRLYAMSPEVVRGLRTLGPPADVWSLAMIAFELLTARKIWRAFEREEDPPMSAILIEIITGQHPIPSARAKELGAPDLPAWFDAWFARCTEREPGHRFADAAAAKAALGTIAPTTVKTMPPVPIEPVVVRGNPKGSTYGRVAPDLLDFTGDRAAPPRRRATWLIVILVAIVVAAIVARLVVS